MMAKAANPPERIALPLEPRLPFALVPLRHIAEPNLSNWAIRMWGLCRRAARGIITVSLRPRFAILRTGSAATSNLPSKRAMPLIRSQTHRLAPVLLGTLLVLAGLGLGPAVADPASCQRYRGELANLNNSVGSARAAQSEIGRLQAYARTLNCEGGRFLFFDTRPPQCGAVEQRIKALNAGYGAENGEVVAARRRQLIGAIGLACASPRQESPTEASGQPGQQNARGGSRVICVKTCDGSYFPMNNLPDGRSGADELCQALCPGTEAVAYSMPNGDEALKYAATIRGSRAYVAMPNAFKFRTNFEQSCTCKREGQGWAQSLAKAESMLFRGKNDIFVTPQWAERLSRPKVRLTLVGRADRTAAELAADAANRDGATRVVDASAGPDGAADAASPAPSSEEKPAIRVIAPAMIQIPARSETP